VILIHCSQTAFVLHTPTDFSSRNVCLKKEVFAYLIFKPKENRYTRQLSTSRKIDRLTLFFTASELVDKFMDVCTDLLCLFLVDKVSNSFHHNHVSQIRHVFLEATVVYIFLDSLDIVDDVFVPHDELRWHFDLQSSPWRSQLPGSAR
jgi:hypothetical protein